MPSHRWAIRKNNKAKETRVLLTGMEFIVFDSIRLFVSFFGKIKTVYRTYHFIVHFEENFRFKYATEKISVPKLEKFQRAQLKILL